jgi:hypothetical protein
MSVHPTKNIDSDEQEAILELTSSDAEFLSTLKIALDTTSGEYAPRTKELGGV